MLTADSRALFSALVPTYARGNSQESSSEHSGTAEAPNSNVDLPRDCDMAKLMESVRVVTNASEFRRVRFTNPLRLGLFEELSFSSELRRSCR
jgi:hypothetical protein